MTDFTPGSITGGGLTRQGLQGAMEWLKAQLNLSATSKVAPADREHRLRRRPLARARTVCR